MKKFNVLLFSFSLSYVGASAQTLTIPAGAQRWCSQQGVDQAVFELTSLDPATIPPQSATTGYNGTAQFMLPSNLPATSTFRITPFKDNDPLNGPTTFTLLQTIQRIQHHLDGTQPFTCLEQWFGADANKDGAVTNADITVLHDLVLGLYNQLPQGQYFRFVPKSFEFENPATPLLPQPPLFIEGTIDELNQDHEFWAFQIGVVPESCPCAATGTEEIIGFTAEQAFPNPAKDAFQVRVNLPESTSLRAQLFDITGKMIWQQPAQSYSSGISTFTFDVNLSAGNYLWKITDAKENFQAGRIVKE